MYETRAYIVACSRSGHYSFLSCDASITRWLLCRFSGIPWTEIINTPHWLVFDGGKKPETGGCFLYRADLTMSTHADGIRTSGVSYGSLRLFNTVHKSMLLLSGHIYSVGYINGDHRVDRGLYECRARAKMICCAGKSCHVFSERLLGTLCT